MRNTQEKFDLTLKAVKYNVSCNLPKILSYDPPISIFSKWSPRYRYIKCLCKTPLYVERVFTEERSVYTYLCEHLEEVTENNAQTNA